MQLRLNIQLIFIIAAVITTAVLISSPTVSAQPRSKEPRPGSFSDALQFLQSKIRYKFKKIEFLRIAVTHPSYSDENNKVFSILGEHVIDISVVLQALRKDFDISPDDLNEKIYEERSLCAAYGQYLRLKVIVRVSLTTDSSASHVVCHALRAIFGAIALDNGEFEDAVNVFLALRRSYAQNDPICYHFKNSEYGKRAFIHSSYSEKNNKAMSILGQSILEATVILRSLGNNVDLSSKDLKYYIEDEANKCAGHTFARIIAENIQVSEKIDPSTSTIVCGAYRAYIAAIALDKGKADAGSRWHLEPVEHSGASDNVYI